MKQFKIAKILHALILMTMTMTMSSYVYAATPKEETAGQYVDDTVLTTKVKAAIFNETALKSSEINVTTNRSVVQLSGFVSTKEQINKAIEVTRAVPGVAAIQNAMMLKDSANY